MSGNYPPSGSERSPWERPEGDAGSGFGAPNESTSVHASPYSGPVPQAPSPAPAPGQGVPAGTGAHPAGTPWGAPAGQATFQPGGQPGFPAGSQPGFPAGGQPGFPPGQQGFPTAGPANFPPGGAANYPPGGQPGFPPGGQPGFPPAGNFPVGGYRPTPAGGGSKKGLLIGGIIGGVVLLAVIALVVSMILKPGSKLDGEITSVSLPTSVGDWTNRAPYAGGHWIGAPSGADSDAAYFRGSCSGVRAEFIGAVVLPATISKINRYSFTGRTTVGKATCGDWLSSYRACMAEKGKGIVVVQFNTSSNPTIPDATIVEIVEKLAAEVS